MFPTLVQLSRAGALALAASFAALTLPPSLHAAPPANDTCAGAILVPGVPYLSPVIDVVNATTNGDPVPLPPYTGLTRSIWFRFVPAASALYTLSVGEDTQTNFGDVNSTDTVMGLYRSASGCGGPLTLVAENDDSGFLRSAITNNLSSGVTYFIVVWVGPVTQETNLALNVQLRVTRPVVPANNLCSSAIAVPTATFPYVSPNIDTLLATTSANEVSSCMSFRGVWFTFTPTATGTYILGLDPEPATSSIEPTMTVFVSSGGCNGPFTELECSANKTRPIIRSNTAGTTYYILIADIDPEPIPGATAIQLRISQAGPPTVTTLPASSIASTGAVLNTVINPNGLRTSYFFEWGMTTSYGSMTPNRTLSLGGTFIFASPANANALVGGITPGVTYHFRAVGSNSMGKIFGADQSFRYSTNRPTIVGHSAQPGGNFHFRFTANSNQVYIIQSTTDLIQWSDWAPAVDRGGGLFDFNMGGSPGTRRFFKVRSP
jgi:hypothetical protein